MKASSKLVSYIRKAEDCKLKAYKDAVGIWTIGYGHTNGVKAGDVISRQQAEDFLRKDLEVFEAAANKVGRLTTQGRFDAVVDFMYNCGIAAFDGSTLKRYIETGKPIWQVQEQFLRWVTAKGQKLGGLVSRRIWEAARFAEE